MSFLPDLNGEFCLRLTLTLLHFLWQGVAIALLAAGVGAALRRAGAAARYWVFVAALGAMALCPPITYHTLTRLEEGTTFPAASAANPDAVSGNDAGTDFGTNSGMGLGAGLKPAPTGIGTPDGGASQPGDETRTSPSLPLPDGEGGNPTLASARTVESPQQNLPLLQRVSRSLSRAFASDAYARVAPWVAGGYFAGVLVMLARLLLALRGGRGLRRHALPVTEPAIRAMFERAAAVLHLRARPALAWCERVAVPTVVGLLKPTILLPVSLSSGLAPEQIEMLLLHELAHLRRHDHWVNLAQWVVETAMFFHPAVWWVSRRIRAERELACDDCVLAAGVAEASYADSLLRMAELSRFAAASDPTAALALGSHGSRFSEFGHRVLRLIEGRDALENLRPARVWPVAVAVLILMVGCYAIICLKAKRGENASVTFSSGIQAEIVGVTKLPRQDNGCWEMNGTRLNRVPEGFELEDFDPLTLPTRMRHGDNTYQVYVRFNNLPPKGDCSAASGMGGQDSSLWHNRKETEQIFHTTLVSIPSESSRTFLRIRLPFSSRSDDPSDSSPRFATLRLGVSSTPWINLAELDDPLHASNTNREKGPFRFSCNEGVVGLGLIKTFSLTVSSSGSLGKYLKEKEVRLVAFDETGQLYEGESQIYRAEGNVPQMSVEVEKIPSGVKIVRCELQTRDYEWREVRNIPLRPRKLELPDGLESNGPLDIQFAGLQVGLGDSLYGWKGEKIGERLNWKGHLSPHTGKNKFFVFRFSEQGPDPTFSDLHAIYRKETITKLPGGGTSRSSGSSMTSSYAPPRIEIEGDTKYAIIETNGLGTGPNTPTSPTVTFSLSYFAGPPGECQYRFSGPLELGKTLKSEGGALFLKESPQRGNGLIVLFIPKPGDAQEGIRQRSILIYDKTGARHLGGWQNEYDGPEGAGNEIWIGNVPPEKVDFITIGEKPYTLVGRGLQFSPSGAQKETEAHLAELARALDIPDLNDKELMQLDRFFSFQADPEKVLRCLPLLRGNLLARAWEGIAFPNRTIKDLSPESAEILHQTALKLSKLPSPEPLLGIEMGLWGGWPEFDTMALDLLLNPKTLKAYRRNKSFAGGSPPDLADLIVKHAKDLPDDQVPRILEALRMRTDIRDFDWKETRDFNRLMNCLTLKNTPATSEALRGFLKDDRPWYWIPAANALKTRGALPEEDKLTSEEKLRLTAAEAVDGPYHPNSQSAIHPEIAPLLLGMLTPDMAKMSHSTYFHREVVLNAIHRHCDKETRTRAFIEVIQKLEPTYQNRDVAIQIARLINLDHGVNLGGLGSKPTPEKPVELFDQQVKQLIGEILEWSKTGVAPQADPSARLVVLEFPEDRSLGFIHTPSRESLEARGRLEIPAWEEYLRVEILEKPESFAFLEKFKPFKNIYSITIENAGFRGEDFQFLGSVTSLQNLYIGNADMTGSGLENLKNMTSLSGLNFWESQIGPQRLSHIQDASSLKGLGLPRCHLTDDVLSHLRVPPTLTSLSLNGNEHLSDRTLENLPDLPALAMLNIAGNAITDGGMKALRKFPALKFLSAQDNAISLENIENLPPLTHLEISGNSVTDRGVKNLEKLSTLKYLNLGKNAITDQGLKTLAGFSEIESLEIGGNPITPPGLEVLKKMPNLHSLGLEGCPFSDSDLAILSDMTSLTQLRLSGTKITDTGIKNLDKLARINGLSLDKTAVTDTGLAQLPELPKLAVLNLAETAITDASIQTLKRFPLLNTLNVDKTQITPQGLAELKRIFPNNTVFAPTLEKATVSDPPPTQPANGKGETATSTTTTTSPVTPGEPGTGSTSTSQPLKALLPSGPLDIRFAGIQVGLGDSVYNLKGEKIGEWLNWPYCYPDRKNLNWRFILDLPETPGPLFTQFNVYRKGETGAEKGYGFSPRRGYLGGGVASPVESDGKTRRVILNMVFQDGTDDPQERPDAVDLVFPYFYGPPNEARYRFSGPFEMEKVSEDQGGTLSLRQYLRSVGSSSSYFVLQSKTPIDMNLPVFAFDKRGERRRCNLISGYGTSLNENSIAISVSGIPLEEIAAITVDEKPYEFRMSGIPISPPPGAREETEAQMAGIARALEVEEVDLQKLQTYHFNSKPQEALRCLPSLRGVPLRNAWWVITDSKKPVGLEDLSPELAEQLHQTALKWAQAPVPHHLLGVEMGLWFGWPEFDSMALDLFLQQKTLTYMASGDQESRQINLLDKVLEHFEQKHLGNLVSRIQDALRIAEKPNDFRSLLGSLVNNESLTTTNALLDLAKDERPWIWFPSVQALVERKALPAEEKLTPQEKLRRHAVLAVSFQNERDPQFSPSPEVKSVFLGMLTPEVKRMSLDIPSCFSIALSAVHRYCDRETSTRAVVETAQILDPYRWYDGSSIRQITEWINQDYGMNIGELRTRPANHSGLSPEQIKQMIDEISTWYRNGAVPGEFRAENPS